MTNPSSEVKKSLKGSWGVMIGVVILWAGVCPIIQGRQLEIPLLTNATELNQFESDTQLTECALAVSALAASQGKLPLEKTILMTYTRLSGHDNITVKVPNWPVIKASPKSKRCSGTWHGMMKVQCSLNGCLNVDSKIFMVKETAQRMIAVWSAGVKRRKKRSKLTEAIEKINALNEEMLRNSGQSWSWYNSSGPASGTDIFIRTALIIGIIVVCQIFLSCCVVPIVQCIVKKNMSVTVPGQYPMSPVVNVES